MKQISPNVYEHKGIKAEAVARQPGVTTCCCGCPFNGMSCLLPEKTCTPIIGADKVFRKYKEPETVKKTELNELIFSVVVLTPERSKILQEAFFAAGGKWQSGDLIVKYTERPVANVMGGMITIDNDIASDHPSELTLQQALDLLATVEKPEPVFDIKLDDLVLCRDINAVGYPWEAKRFARFEGKSGWPFVTLESKFCKMIKLSGNEKYHGSDDTPSGWWEARNSKPVWVTK